MNVSLAAAKCRLEEEYKWPSDDTDMREALNSLMEQEREQSSFVLQTESWKNS